MKVLREKWLWLVVLILLATTFGVEAQEPKTVKVGHFVATNSGGLYIAQDRGYFAEQGIRAVFEAFADASKAYPALATSEIDIYGGGLSPGLYNAIARGIPLKVVADKSHEEKGYGFKVVVARKDLYDSGKFRSIRDIKGMVVAGLPRGASMDYQLDLILRPNGLGLQDVQYVGMSMPDTIPALTSKRIDAAFVMEPIVTRIVEQGLGVKITSLDQWAPGFQGGAIIYGEAFIKNSPDLARRFMVAYVKGLRDYNDAIKGKPIRKEVVEILMKWTPLKDPKLYDKLAWTALDPNGSVSTKYLMHEQEWYLKEGLIRQVIPLEKFVDQQYVEHAVKVLGKYE